MEPWHLIIFSDYQVWANSIASLRSWIIYFEKKNCCNGICDVFFSFWLMILKESNWTFPDSSTCTRNINTLKCTLYGISAFLNQINLTTAMKDLKYLLQMIVPHVCLNCLAGACDLQATRPRALEYYVGQILQEKDRNRVIPGLCN